MDRKAVIDPDTNLVTNIVLVDPENVPDFLADFPWATAEAGIGGTYNSLTGSFTPPPEPPSLPAPVPQSLSFAQMLIGLVTEGWLTEGEARAWRDRVALPPQVAALIYSLPEEQQFAAETRAMAPSEILRADPLVIGLGAVAGKTEEELDDFFRTYAGV